MRHYIPRYIPSEPWKRITSVIRDYANMVDELASGADCSDAHRLELQRKVAAFEVVWSRTDDTTRQIVKMKFVERKTYRDMWLPMSESSMKRLIREFIQDLGHELGEI